jgi:hypothetical protein
VNFITWVGIAYKNINSKVQVNGLLTNIVPITRSIRQGCPLSMSLYALIIETLASTSWCICGWLRVSGVPIFRISVFCSFMLDPDTCPKFLNSLIRSSYSEISVLTIEQSSAC